MIAIFAAVSVGYWYAANYEYLSADESMQNTAMPTTNTTAAPSTEAVTGSDDNPVEPAMPQPPSDPADGTVQSGKSQVQITTLVIRMLGVYERLKAAEQDIQFSPLSNLDASMDLGSSIQLDATGSVLIEEVTPRQEIRSLENDNDDDDHREKDRPSEVRVAEETSEPALEESDKEDEQRNNGEVDDDTIYLPEERVDEAQEMDEQLSEALDRIKELSENDKDDKSDNNDEGQESDDDDDENPRSGRGDKGNDSDDDDREDRNPGSDDQSRNDSDNSNKRGDSNRGDD